MNKKNIVRYLPLFALCVVNIQAMNFLRPYDTLVRPQNDSGKRFYAELFAEFGVSDANGYDAHSNDASVLKIWNTDQNAIKMLQGFDPNTKIGQKLAALDVTDDGTRGHFCVDGDLKMRFGGSLNFGAWFGHGFSLNLYLPFYSMELDNVCWQEQTLMVDDEDFRIKNLLTNDFFNNVKQLGECLDLTGWKRNGFGDATVLVQWLADFRQNRPLLKNVRINTRLGFILPSGKPRDEDKLFALPFGYDGSTGILYGGGLDVSFGRYFKAGFDIELLHLFGNTRDRRIKTDPCQTELLLLAKACAHKDWGLTQRFNLFVQAFRFYNGLSCLLGYQYFKHGDDELSLSSQEFSSKIANTAISLEEWTMHHVVFRVDYDAFVHMDDDARVYPSASVFARVPVKGQRAVLAPTVGLRLAVSF